MNSITSITLSLAGLVVLADITTVLERTVLIGTSHYSDALFLAPGLHRQQDASKLHGGEFPAVGAMNSGYVFRIENQAMVFWLQRVSRPGHLADVRVEPVKPTGRLSLSGFLYATGIALTVSCFIVLGSIRDYWAVGVLAMLVVARGLNTVIFKRRAVAGWKGVKEPGARGDLLLLLSQDRWVRVRGSVDDLKLVTSGQWVRDLERTESLSIVFATLLVYCAAALNANSSPLGSLLIALLLLVSTALLELCNALTVDLTMFGCKVYRTGSPKAYKRRIDMAEEMIKTHDGRRDWAVGMGLVLPQSGEEGKQVIM